MVNAPNDMVTVSYGMVKVPHCMEHIYVFMVYVPYDMVTVYVDKAYRCIIWHAKSHPGYGKCPTQPVQIIHGHDACVIGHCKCLSL
jgi:hypothetical protein